MAERVEHADADLVDVTYTPGGVVLAWDGAELVITGTPVDLAVLAARFASSLVAPSAT